MFTHSLQDDIEKEQEHTGDFVCQAGNELRPTEILILVWGKDHNRFFKWSII